MSPYSVAVRILSSALPFDLSVGGGDEGIRTLDPLRARQVLSQLSYTPMGFHWLFNFANGLKWTRTTDLTLIRRAL